MKPPRPQRASRASTSRLARLRARLAEAEATLLAIRTGEVDALVVNGKAGRQIFTLQGAEQPYRVLIESMNEGALTLTAGKTILYANQCFARMVKCPLEQVTGGAFRRFVSSADRVALGKLLKLDDPSGSKIQVLLKGVDGSQTPVQISFSRFAQHGGDRASLGMVVTDMSEARRTEELLRALANRVTQTQEAERGSVALDLHDNITQLLCAILVRHQTLADKFSSSDKPSRVEAVKLRKMLGDTAEAVERISRELRPGVLDLLGFVAVLRDAGAKFQHRTGVVVTLAGVQHSARLPAATELVLYRILEEALANLEKHARAGHVSVGLVRQGAFVELTIQDDGVGFDPEHRTAQRRGKAGLGLLGMRERAAYVGGALMIKSSKGGGTTIRARIPFVARR